MEPLCACGLGETKTLQSVKIAQDSPSSATADITLKDDEETGKKLQLKLVKLSQGYRIADVVSDGVGL